MRARSLLVPVVLLAVASVPQTARAQEPPAAPRIAIDDGGSALPLVSWPLLPFTPAIRVSGGLADSSLEARLGALAARKTPIWLAVAAPATVNAVEAWRASLQTLLGRYGEWITILEIESSPDAKLAVFSIRLGATEARSADESIRVALGPPRGRPAGWLTNLYTVETAPYLDLLALSTTDDEAAASAHLLKVDPEARLAILVDDVWTDVDRAVRRIIDLQLDTAGTNVAIVAWRSSDAVQRALPRLAPLAPLLTGDISVIASPAVRLTLSLSGRDVTSSVRHRLLFDNRTFATYLVYWGESSPTLLQVSLTLPVEGEPVVYALADGSVTKATDYSRDSESSVVRVRVPLTGWPMLVDFNAGATAVFAERSDVAAERRLSVQEIIARHQQQQRAQDAVVRNYIASARTSQHFRPTMTDPGYDVVTENRYYVAADGIEWEELSFSVNGSKWGADRPPFPLLQPEKVLSLPLQLRFDNDYRYQLEGTERIGEYDCYVIGFEPSRSASAAQSLYRGMLWIDRKTFARVRVSAVQTGLSAPVVSNEEIQTYLPITSIGNRPVFLFAGLTARQIILIAGRNILVEKTVAFDRFRVNDPAFEEARTGARRSDSIMFKETDKGLRYFVKQGNDRIVSERATRTARAMAMGVTFDPSYAYPLPIFGINYLNFEFGGADTQLAILFAGVLAAGNVQKPKLGRTPFDASVDFFAIAVPSSDRLYDASGEREAERLLTWPLSTGVNLGWQYTPFQKLSAQYQFRFDGFVRDTTTADSFVVPASTVTNGFGGGWEYRRGGYSAVVNGAWFARSGWREWGFEPDPAPQSTYVKYTASISRDFYFNVFHKVHLNGAWFGGRDLDRFAKYQFGMFDDTRIHGVPASGVRFEELGMIRGSYSFNIFEQYRLDVFVEQAWGRDKTLDPVWQPITGIGAALNLRAPWSTILRIDGGKSFLPERYEGIGSATLQVMLLKPMR
jgi:hypothetical protein